MADKEDVLFDDSDDGGDTDELIAASKATSKPKIAKPKKKRLQKKGKVSRKSNIPDADNDDSDDDAFADSDDDTKPPSTKKSKPTSSKPLTKREKMEALAQKRKQGTSGDPSPPAGEEEEGEEDAKPKSKEKDPNRIRKRKPDGSGYDSGDSYNSAAFVRTKDDDDFIDNEGEDEELVREYNAEQHFDDERHNGEYSDDEDGKSNKRKGSASSKPRRNGADVLSDVEDGEEEPSNPISAAVWRMKKNKRVKKSDLEMIEGSKEFLQRMDAAADDDDRAIQEKKPAMKKLAMLNETLQTLAKVEMMPHLLDEDLLIVCKRWVQPLPNGTLGNITVRKRLLESIGNMNGVSTDHLKRSGFGKVVMTLHMHSAETPSMKKLLKQLIEQWSRPIFKREGNLRHKPQGLDVTRDSGGITGYARAQQAHQMNRSKGGRKSSTKKHRTTDDLSSIIASGYQSKSGSMGNNRVQVPYSKGFQFSVRPRDKIDPSSMKGRGSLARSELNKKMISKRRTGSKINRSVNMSADGKGLHK